MKTVERKNIRRNGFKTINRIKVDVEQSSLRSTRERSRIAETREVDTKDSPRAQENRPLSIRT